MASPLGSEKDALVSATTDDEGAGSSDSSTGGGAKARSEAEAEDSVTSRRLESKSWGEKKREEKGGGPTELEGDASEGECGGGGAV